MNIEIHQPELEALIQRRMATGEFRSIEDLLYRSLDASSVNEAQHREEETLDAVFAPLRGLFADGELDFRRNASMARPVELS